MPKTTWTTRPSMMQLILVPALITLAVTILRLVGELQHWTPRLFSAEPGGGGALVGISWLPFIFGPYFAVKLANNGDGPSGKGKSIRMAVVGLVLMVGGVVMIGAPQITFPGHMLIGLALVVASALVQWSSWPGLFKSLLAYGYAARIPVAIIMFFAIRGSWGTHYDGAPPNYNGPADFLGKYAYIGLLPQLVLWPAFTVVVGSLAGTIVAAIARRGKPVVQAAS